MPRFWTCFGRWQIQGGEGGIKWEGCQEDCAQRMFIIEQTEGDVATVAVVESVDKNIGVLAHQFGGTAKEFVVQRRHVEGELWQSGQPWGVASV